MYIKVNMKNREINELVDGITEIVNAYDLPMCRDLYEDAHVFENYNFKGGNYTQCCDTAECDGMNYTIKLDDGAFADYMKVLVKIAKVCVPIYTAGKAFLSVFSNVGEAIKGCMIDFNKKYDKPEKYGVFTVEVLDQKIYCIVKHDGYRSHLVHTTHRGKLRINFEYLEEQGQLYSGEYDYDSLEAAEAEIRQMKRLDDYGLSEEEIEELKQYVGLSTRVIKPNWSTEKKDEVAKINDMIRKANRLFNDTETEDEEE